MSYTVMCVSAIVCPVDLADDLHRAPVRALHPVHQTERADAIDEFL